MLTTALHKTQQKQIKIMKLRNSVGKLVKIGLLTSKQNNVILILIDSENFWCRNILITSILSMLFNVFQVGAMSYGIIII